MKIRLIGLVAITLSGAAQASPVFEGRSSNGAIDLTCTAHGDAGTNMCAMFYHRNLDITILNNWSIGAAPWDGYSPSTTTAQTLAEAAGSSATGLTGWGLPTGDATEPAGALNQFKSIWNDVGASFSFLEAQFAGVRNAPFDFYWSSTIQPGFPGRAYGFYTGDGRQFTDAAYYALSVVAVRPGDVAQAVPEPQTYALMLVGLCLMGLVTRRDKKKQS
ncbi:DUF1566 domain-containing protein [Paucibacter sp. B2R-40]|nr:DUF1566 domain-containing protein [Paucibacter sp. B2R-40]